MKRVRVQTPKKNDLRMLGKLLSLQSSPMLKSLSVQRNRKKLEKRLSSQEHHHSIQVQSVGMEDQINRLQAEWEEIKQNRKKQASRESQSKLPHRLSQKYHSTPYYSTNEAQDVKYARIDLAAQESAARPSQYGRQRLDKVTSPDRLPLSHHYMSVNEEVKPSRKKIKIAGLKMLPIKHPQKRSSANIATPTHTAGGHPNPVIIQPFNSTQELRLSQKTSNVAAGGVASITLNSTKKSPIKLVGRVISAASPTRRFEIKL